MKYRMQFSSNKNHISIIKTKRLVLMCPDIKHSSSILDAVKASSDEIYPWLPWATKELTLQDIENYINYFSSCHNDEKPPALFFDIFDLEKNKYLGNIYFGQIDWRLPSFSIGYWLDSRESRKGYMTEAVNALAKVAFKHFKANRIEISTSKDNVGARKIPERLNFQLEAEFINHHINYVTKKVSNTMVYSVTSETELPDMEVLSWNSKAIQPNTRSNDQVYHLKEIETPRLIIRPVQLGDEIPLNKAVNNSLEILQKWQPWANDPSIEATRNFVQRGVFAWGSFSVTDFPMVVILKDEQKIIAASGFNDRSDVDQGLFEIGYWCDVDYQGNGYVTEYANALTRYALDHLNASKVVISMQVENKKSIAVAKRLGFINSGEKDRPEEDCVSLGVDKNYVFEATSTEHLPPLKVSWKDHDNKNSISKIISWSKNTLKINDESAFANSRAIISCPWSDVIEMNSPNNVYYLKRTPPDLFIEAKVINLLQDECGCSSVPKVIATNPDHHCFIMNKCGDLTLREHLSGNFDLELFIAALKKYRTLLKSTSKVVQTFIGAGAPDWRLDSFPSHYEQMVTNDTFLSEYEIDNLQKQKLRQCVDKVKSLCDNLAAYGIPECLNHSDFHDNNILYDISQNRLSIIDLGETAINHPFFSLVAFLWATKNRYSLQESSHEALKLKNAAFKGWIDDDKTLNNALDIVNQLMPIYLLFAQKRFIDAIHLPRDPSSEMSQKQHDKIHKGFVWFLDNMADG